MILTRNERRIQENCRKKGLELPQKVQDSIDYKTKLFDAILSGTKDTLDLEHQIAFEIYRCTKEVYVGVKLKIQIEFQEYFIILNENEIYSSVRKQVTSDDIELLLRCSEKIDKKLCIREFKKFKAKYTAEIHDPSPVNNERDMFKIRRWEN